MVVVHVLESMGAGVLSSVSLSCNELSKRGFEVYLIYSPNREETPENWRGLFSSNISFCQINMVRSISPFQDILSLYKLIMALQEISPDVVHLHSSKAGVLGRAASLFVKSCGVWIYSPRGLSYINDSDSRVKRFFFYLIEKVFAKAFPRATIVACSQSELKMIELLRKNNLALVENAMDNCAEEIYKTRSEILRIATIGRVSKQKNPSLLCRVARKLALDNERGVEFVWIGGGDESYTNELLDAGVSVTGWKEKSEVINMLRDVDVYIQTSFYEGMPVSVIEAQRAGIPSVVSDVVGNRDVVENEVTGFICDSEEDFCQAINILSDDKYRLCMGGRARDVALIRFSPRRLGDDLERLYQGGCDGS